MKTRESGMPEEPMWQGFFDPAAVLGKLQLNGSCRDAVDFGCGYGTFAIPAARIVSGTVYALDIEPAMIAVTEAKARAAGLSNVRTVLRDFVAEGTGLPDASVNYAMLLNILHAECPDVLLGEAFRVLAPGGKLAITHWNYDPTTPRGPSMDIRPRPEQCRRWAEDAGFRLLPPGITDLPPYHYGLLLERPDS
jgi:ubiquinone/menaquinone biosynthesis C-methylase UbiE